MKKNFNKSGKRPKVPDDLGGKMILFQGIESDSAHARLNGLVLLTTEDEKESNFVFGLIVNQNFHMNMHRYMKSQGLTLQEKFHFVRMADAGEYEIDPFGANTIGFLMPRENNFIERTQDEILAVNMQKFKDFALYVTESPEEAADLMEKMGPEEKCVILYGQFFLQRDSVAGLILEGKAVCRDANPEFVLNRSPYMRAKLTFPEFFNGKNHGPQAKGPA